jgi:hypothetical protein
MVVTIALVEGMNSMDKRSYLSNSLCKIINPFIDNQSHRSFFIYFSDINKTHWPLFSFFDLTLCFEDNLLKMSSKEHSKIILSY